MLDVVNFWEVVLFSWLTGNADMHLKNFSLFCPADNYILTPAYDLLSTSIVLSDDNEELALTLNGKKRKIKREDFEQAMYESGVDKKVIANLFSRFSDALPKWRTLVQESFLPEELRVIYLEKIEMMSEKISISITK